ncbi:MAG: class I SAM-dependent DNA methyltransferase, partial [Verrucomicrobia bacterium]|nr:class I SAM-dependent DNA methyltransferase [Verrucomicrobiota bacterium]
IFERDVTFRKHDGSTAPGRIDLYKRGCFVLEAKQGSDTGTGKIGHGRRGSPGYEQAMIKARNQADRYIRALPHDEGRPPFLLVADIGHVIEIFAEFSRSGGTYLPFPSPGSHRVALSDLRKPEIRDRLRLIWTDPLALDPSRRAARVTREVADKLAKLALSLEKNGEEPHTVARFLMRCLFTMFAEDVNLLGKYGFQPFTRLLEDIAEDPASFVPMIEELWGKMNTGGYSTALRLNLLQFNGGLFAEARALPLDKEQIRLLIASAECDWRDVEPAIFGTLLERALDPVERHKLGAHYTPRAYVERLVLPTVIAPVREEWDAVLAAAIKHDNDGKRKESIRELKAFHRRLCHLRILDPACGSGNFLYVTLEHLKRIEGEVLDTLQGFGETQSSLDLAGESVDPHQLLGIEINPRAAAIAELVLWIGALQGHFRNRGNVMPPQPIIRDFKNIECRDALITADGTEPVLDPEGRPVTHWDGRSTKPHPVTGLPVPDESARVPEVRYLNPRKAEWPEADYIIGNPPFIGASRMRDALGDGYTDTVRTVHNDIAESSDFVMYWWNHAAELVAQGKARRFGFVTTNSLKQTFNRRVLEKHLTGKPPVHLAYAVPDHPWVDDGAAVRIAMTSLAPGEGHGELHTVTQETDEGTDGYSVELLTKTGRIGADLTIGPDVASAVALRANGNLSNRGVSLFGSGFIVSREDATKLGLGKLSGTENIIREYRNGKDITAKSRDVLVIDCFGLTLDTLSKSYPEIFQWLLERVKPERDNNKRESRKKNWWLFGETNPKLRQQLNGLPLYISSVETSKPVPFAPELPCTIRVHPRASAVQIPCCPQVRQAMLHGA